MPLLSHKKIIGICPLEHSALSGSLIFRLVGAHLLTNEWLS